MVDVIRNIHSFMVRDRVQGGPRSPDGTYGMPEELLQHAIDIDTYSRPSIGCNMTTLSWFSLICIVSLLQIHVNSFTFSRAIMRPRQGSDVVCRSSVSPEDNFDNYDVLNQLQGLAIKDTLIGTGEEAKRGDVVTVAYEGRLIPSGKKFDEGVGFSFPLGKSKVIPGWEQGIVGMKVGGKRSLRIPPSLAYGDRGARDVIPPGAHIEFDCELKSIASNPIEAAMAQVNMSTERIAGFAVIFLIWALAPLLT